MMVGYKLEILVIDVNAEKVRDNIYIEAPEILDYYDIKFVTADIKSDEAIMALKDRPKVNYRITPEEMWSCVKGSSMNWGIEGYEIPKHYYDYHQVKWQQERKVILEKHKRVWPPQDWPKSKEDDKLIPPHRPNFIENYIKWANSFNDEKKIRRN